MSSADSIQILLFTHFLLTTSGDDLLPWLLAILLSLNPIWGLKSLWFIRTVKSLTSVRQLQKQTLHCPIQGCTCFSMNKSAKPWKEEPDCLLNIRLGKIRMSRISRCIAVFNVVAHSQQHNHVKEENFNSCGLPLPWQQRRKESDGRWESIMWQWCHGTTGSDHHHVSYVVPLLCSVSCILHITVRICCLRVIGSTGDTYKSCTRNKQAYQWEQVTHKTCYHQNHG